jgi:hypothetical protein
MFHMVRSKIATQSPGKPRQSTICFHKITGDARSKRPILFLANNGLAIWHGHVLWKAIGSLGVGGKRQTKSVSDRCKLLLEL